MMRAVGEIQIRNVQGFGEYERLADLQRDVWSFPDLDIVPAAHLVAVHHYGGVCIGAFDGEVMVGFVFGFVGRDLERVFHHSHMLGVLPTYQRQGLGESLKWAQRQRVQAQGMDLINWTYDPLQAPNANLNINRLGAVVRKYMLNVYGESVSPLHGGIPTDRFEAEWWLQSPRVLAAREGRRPERQGWEQLPRANRAFGGRGEFLSCGEDLQLEIDSDELLIEIPPAITPIMARDRELALDWRLKTRKIFQAYLGRGYAVVGLHRSEGRVFYRVEKGSADR
ncbi:MAG: GNAT family N-acetyltransferase [Acidobacteriota bacterium]